jgi:cytochrome c oxidase cbb3-type subunit 4
MQEVGVEMSVLGVDIDTLRALVLITLVIAFLGMWAWAWSKKRKTTFQDASMLPLEDDQVVSQTSNRTKNGIGE